ncbi:hypothetical protein AVEN_46275-1 [Araneus ventricosus]|uniref:DUF5641 domain-containing protein n=1 Tax=Araneus ventricosus TaxID=182803 RepID=A0A4Y2I611_ARAVE|nr:hypothetical protein AVEN_46275-1 [Araneus ventricosus]
MASWWGGFWERLVRVIKELLRRSLGKSILSFEELRTVLCECKSAINSRPLTYVSENSDDLIPLTPSMFMIENRNFSTCDIDLVETQSFRRRIKFKAKLLKDFRLRFRKEYFSLLFQKHSRNRSVREPQIGEVVLIGDDSKKRLNWYLAIIMEVSPGRDRKVHTVKVKTQSGVTTRPLQRLYPLELSVDQVNSLKHEMINIVKKIVCSGSPYGVNEYGLDLFNQNMCF